MKVENDGPLAPFLIGVLRKRKEKFISAFVRVFKNVFYENVQFKKIVLIGTITIMFLLLSSCASLLDLALDTTLGRNKCFYPECNRTTIENSSYCSIHTPSQLKGAAYIEIDSKNVYKLHNPLQINDTATIKKKWEGLDNYK